METDIKLTIILNGLTDVCRYLVVNLEQQKDVDFDELCARLLEEECSRTVASRTARWIATSSAA